VLIEYSYCQERTLELFNLLYVFARWLGVLPASRQQQINGILDTENLNIFLSVYHVAHFESQVTAFMVFTRSESQNVTRSDTWTSAANSYMAVFFCNAC
jgi:hypothetical protein